MFLFSSTPQKQPPHHPSLDAAASFHFRLFDKVSDEDLFFSATSEYCWSQLEITYQSKIIPYRINVASNGELYFSVDSTLMNEGTCLLYLKVADRDKEPLIYTLDRDLDSIPRINFTRFIFNGITLHYTTGEIIRLKL